MIDDEFPRLRLIETCLLQQHYQALQDLTESEAQRGLISSHALDAARCMRSPVVVTYLATLCVENLPETVDAHRWLAVYQSIGQGQATPDFQRLCSDTPLAAVAEVVMGQRAIKDLSFKGFSTHRLQDWYDAAECAMDFQRYEALLLLVKALATRKLGTVEWLNLARVLFSRQDHIRSCFEIENLAHSCLRIRDHLPHHVPALVAVRSTLAMYACRAFALAHNNEQVLATAPLANTSEDRHFGQFETARALCRLQRLPESIEQLDRLVASMGSYHLAKGIPTPDNLPANVKKPVFEVAQASRALVDLQDVLERVGQKAFLVSGTLLGYAREGQLLSHDKDIDVGIVGWEDQFDVARALLESGLFDVDLGRLHGARTYHLPVVHKATQVPIDVFIYHPENGQWVTGVESDFGYVQRFAFSPFGLQRVKFLGVDFYVPDDIDKKLTENFGNWGESDPCYISHLESPSTVDVGGPEYQVVARLRAIEAMACGDGNKLSRVVSIMERMSDRPYSMNGPALLALKAYLQAQQPSEVAHAA